MATNSLPNTFTTTTPNNNTLTITLTGKGVALVEDGRVLFVGTWAGLQTYMVNNNL